MKFVDGLAQSDHRVEKNFIAMEAAGFEMFQRVYGGCISTDDLAVRRRPYHHNCSCALHKSGGSHCSHVAKVSYPIRWSLSESSMLAIKSMASPGSSPCCQRTKTL
ncbi:hypothetical protein L1887_38386 [Cichorium endivia]|nr:hypothetical protein L1887_38386 [Cichorium endivia]